MPAKGESLTRSLLQQLEGHGALTTREVAELLRVSVTTVWRLARSGTLPAIWVGGQLRFDRAAVQRWLREGTTGEPGVPQVRFAEPHINVGRR